MKSFKQFLTEQWTVHDHKTDGSTVRVKKNPNGSYYGEADKFDFEAKDHKELHKKLTKWGYNTDPAGYEHK